MQIFDDHCRPNDALKGEVQLAGSTCSGVNRYTQHMVRTVPPTTAAGGLSVVRKLSTADIEQFPWKFTFISQYRLLPVNNIGQIIKYGCEYHLVLFRAK